MTICAICKRKLDRRTGWQSYQEFDFCLKHSFDECIDYVARIDRLARIR